MDKNTLSIPIDVINRIIKLHNFFYNELQIDSPMARATGVIFLQKFYYFNKKNPPKYSIYAIASLHLSSKVCEVARSMRSFVEKAVSFLHSDNLVSVFEGLDGIEKKYSDSHAEYASTLTQKLIQAEMEIISALGFNFEVTLPYDFCESYISRILKWHIPCTSSEYLVIKTEIKNCAWALANDLQFTPEFYIFEPKIIALSCVKMAFERLNIPLIDPVSQKWNNVLEPEINSDVFEDQHQVVREYILHKYLSTSLSYILNRKFKSDIQVFNDWIVYPFDPRQIEPRCEPPSITSLDQLMIDDKSFLSLDCDHIPKQKPPVLCQYSIQEQSRELKRLLLEFDIYENTKVKSKMKNSSSWTVQKDYHTRDFDPTRFDNDRYSENKMQKSGSFYRDHDTKRVNNERKIFNESSNRGFDNHRHIDNYDKYKFQPRSEKKEYDDRMKYRNTNSSGKPFSSK